MMARATQPGYEFASAENIGDRKEQQDRVLTVTHPVHEDVALAAIADGMGGHKGGAIAAQAVIDAVRGLFDAFSPTTGSPQDWLTGMLMAAHERVAASGKGFNRDPRSTCVLALAQKGRIDWAYCGDSRLYLFRGGEFELHTEDHSMVAVLVQQGKITEEEALVHPDRSKLYTSLGGPEAPHIAYGSIDKVDAGDTILLASDGLWTYFRNRELAGLTAYRSLPEACDRLISLARKRAAGAGDNLTVAMIRRSGVPRKGLLGGLFGGKPVPPSPFEDSRRFLLAYLRRDAAPADEIARRVEACTDADQLRALIDESEQAFARMTSRAKASAFAARARDLLE